MLSSIHNAWRLSFAAFLVAIGGCQTMQNDYESAGRRYDTAMATPREKINKYVRPSMTQVDPVMPDAAVDEAMAARGWDTFHYAYPSGGVVAGPTYGLSYEDRPK